MKKRKETKQQKLKKEKNQLFVAFFFERDSFLSSTCVVFSSKTFQSSCLFATVYKLDTENGILAEEISLGRRSNGKRSVFE